MADFSPQTDGKPSSTVAMADRVRLFDWSRTPLGPSSHWPQSLRTAASIVLNSRCPMYLAWGQSLTSIYNDAYRPTLGTKPEALGRPLEEVWAEAWPIIGPIAERAQAGESSFFEDLPLPLLEGQSQDGQAHWTFSCSPVIDESGGVGGVLCLMHEKTGEVKARAALNAQREYLERLFEQAPGFIAVLSGPDHTYELVNESQRRLAPGRNILGKPVREAFPELQGQGIFELLDQVYRTGQPHLASGLRVLLADAAGAPREHYVDFIYQPVRGEDGAVSGIFVEGQDVTARVTADAAVHENEARLRLAIDAGRMAIWAVDPATGELVPSPELNRMFGLPPEARPSAAALQARYCPGELERVQALYRRAQERGDHYLEVEFSHIRADTGKVGWLAVRALMDGDASLPTLGVIMDVTERKQAEERLMLLAHEVDHRANNLLASVQSVVSLTRAEDIPRFRESVLGRISALAHAHRLLAEARWVGARLTRLVEEELHAFSVERRVSVEGPDANLAPTVAQGLAIALHELATNAVKYGSLSTDGGRILVTWGLPDKDGLVQMTWLERGGPPVSEPTRTGFGTTLLRRALSGVIGGSVEFEWPVEGLCCRLRFPVL
jgi:PAS domain S-box-containing protein